MQKMLREILASGSREINRGATGNSSGIIYTCWVCALSTRRMTEQATDKATKRQKLASGGITQHAAVRSGFEKDVSFKRTAANSAAPLMPGVNYLGESSSCAFYPGMFPSEDSQIFQRLQEEVPWEQQEIVVMGRKVVQPRLVAYMADDPSLSYTYSQRQQVTIPWTATVAQIKARVEQLAGTSFNSCLLNLYRNGKDSLSWHSDNEKVYGNRPTIGSVSFGSPRDFVLRNNADHSRKYTVSLGGGSVLVMSGNCQRDWQHAVPKRSGVACKRINLTFRKVMELQENIE